LAVGITAALAALAGFARAAEPKGQSTVPVGVAKIDVTPDVPVRMYGYASRTTESEGVVQKLWAKALAIGDDEGDGRAVLLMVDNGAVPAALVEDLASRLKEKAGIRRERFVLANTHIHSGPRPGKFPPPEDIESLSSEEQHTYRFMTQLSERMEKVVLDALASRKPARLAWTQGTVGFAGNRRTLKDGKWVGFGQYPDGPVDHSLPMLKVTDGDGKLIAVVVNYACHNTTLRANFVKIHADWGGCAQQFIEADHPGAVALVLIGCGADADPYPHGTAELAEQHGRAVADEVRRLLEGPALPIRAKLTTRMTRIRLPLQEPPAREELERRVKAAEAPKASSQDRRLGRRAKRFLERLDGDEEIPKAIDYPLAAWAFDDDLAMVFLAGEVVVDYSLRLKRELDGSRLWINAYSHEVPGYIVTKRLLAEGGYETESYPSPLAPETEDILVSAVRKLVPKTFHSPAAAAAATAP
jgi:hypothetical protein